MLERNSNPNSLITALDALNPSVHTLGASAILVALLKNKSSIDWDTAFNRVNVFIAADADVGQIALCPAIFADVCAAFADQLIKRSVAILGLMALKKAIEKLQNGNKLMLTAVHADLCRLALAARCPTAVKDVLGDFYSEVCAGVDAAQIVLFFYYGGVILGALKEFKRSAQFFESCVSVPAVVVSHVMLEAYKKLVLIGLINEAATNVTLPKYTSPVVTKYFKQLAGPYHDVANAFESSNLKAAVTRHEALFKADGNSGLVEQVLVAQTKYNIKRLTKTFLTLSTEELATRVGLNSAKEAEAILVCMVAEGAVAAKICHRDGMVKFDTGPPEDNFNSENVLKSAEAKLDSCIELDRVVRRMDDDVSVTPMYVRRSVAAAVASAASSGLDLSMDQSAGGGGMSNGGPVITSSSSSSANNAAGNGFAMF